MPRSRRAASKEALKQMQLLSASAYEDAETFEITSDDEVVNIESPAKKKYRLSHRKSSDGNDRDVIVLKTIRYGEETLRLEAWPEDLSPVQLAMHNKAQAELKEMNARVDQIVKQMGGEIIYQGDTCGAYQIGSNPPSLTFTGGSSAVVPQSNVILQPAGKSKNNQNSYQLVMDPRLGLIVGTVTSPTTGNTTTPPTATPSPTMTTRQTRRRGRPSNASTASAQPPPTSVQSTPPQKLQRQAALKTKTAATHTPVVQLRPAESTAIGGLSTGGTTAPQKAVTANVVDLTSDDARPAADSREISFNKLQGKTFPSLVVVARPQLRVKDVGNDRNKLDAKVKNVLMHVPTKFTEWLIQQGLVRSEQCCTVHPSSKLKLGMYSDVSKFPYSGGYVWISECCPQRFVSVFSGSLFEGSPHPPNVILKLMYHWCCQTNVQNVVQWVKVDNLYVKGMNTWLRAICTVALHTHISPLGGPGRRVEVGVISLGTTSQDGQQRQVKVEVLGLLESEAKLIRLRAVEPLADGDRNYKKRFSKILEPLLQWVHPESIIITDLTVDKGTLHSMGFAHVQQSTSSDHGSGNHTIMEYLRRIVPRMFQNTLSLLSRQIIQQFLDELVWREWYGPTSAQAFDSIISHLSEQTRTDTGISLIVRLNKVSANPFKNWNVNQNPSVAGTSKAIESTSLPSKRSSTRARRVLQQKSASPSPDVTSRPPKIHSPDIPEQMVPLESYYYGMVEGFEANSHSKMGWNIKCTMCKSHFTNNIRLMTHLFSHAHSVSGASQQCRYCLSSVATPEGLAKHIMSHPYETRLDQGFVCVICEMRFPNSFSLGKHLSREHVPAELPYQCGTCGYRCSSHRQAVDHFYKTHDSGATIQCPFCLKSTSVWSGGRVMPQNLNFFMQHLQKHQKKAMAKKCPKCALWFIHKDTLKEHQMKMHLTQRRKTGLVPWTAPRNGIMVPKSKQDKQAWEESDINFSTLTINAPSRLFCKECKLPVNTPTHFQSLDSCSNGNCQYTTCCKNAMQAHSKICKDLNTSLPMHLLPSEMHCICGYSEIDGNILAKHLAECERKSAYPTSKAATTAAVTHSMLDVLGLVRRPEEPTSSSTEENTSKDIITVDLGEDENEDKDNKEEEENSEPPPKRRKLNLLKGRKTKEDEQVAEKEEGIADEEATEDGGSQEEDTVEEATENAVAGEEATEPMVVDGEAVESMVGDGDVLENKISEANTVESVVDDENATEGETVESLVDNENAPESSVTEGEAMESTVGGGDILESTSTEGEAVQSMVTEGEAMESTDADETVPKSIVSEEEPVESTDADGDVPEGTVSEGEAVEDAVADEDDLDGTVAASGEAMETDTTAGEAVEDGDAPVSDGEAVEDGDAPVTDEEAVEDEDAPVTDGEAVQDGNAPVTDGDTLDSATTDGATVDSAEDLEAEVGDVEIMDADKNDEDGSEKNLETESSEAVEDSRDEPTSQLPEQAMEVDSETNPDALQSTTTDEDKETMEDSTTVAGGEDAAEAPSEEAS